MLRVALLVQQMPEIEDGNYHRIGTALIAAGYEVTLLSVDSLRLVGGTVCAEGTPLYPGLAVGDPFPTRSTEPINHDVLWIMSLGERVSFLDKMQLLYALPDSVKIVNSLDALMHLKSKYLIASASTNFPVPETHASPDANELAIIIQKQGGKWIAKPPAGSLGRDVFLLDECDQNLIPVLQHLCGPDNNQYTMIQRYLPEIEQGEKRVLIAGGVVVGQYLRKPGADHRTNVNQGAQIEACSLTDEEHTLCEQIGAGLTRLGARYAGIDLVYPHLIEANVINPGGLTTISDLTGENLGPTVAERVMASLSERR